MGIGVRVTVLAGEVAPRQRMQVNGAVGQKARPRKARSRCAHVLAPEPLLCQFRYVHFDLHAEKVIDKNAVGEEFPHPELFIDQQFVDGNGLLGKIVDADALRAKIDGTDLESVARDTGRYLLEDTIVDLVMGETVRHGFVKVFCGSGFHVFLQYS